MSGLTPHIRVLRALAAKSSAASEQAKEPLDEGRFDSVQAQAGAIASVLIFATLADVLGEAADQLEAEVAALKLPMHGDSDGFSYYRGGKPPPGASER